MIESSEDIIDLSNYEKIAKIGQGAFGEVFKIKDKVTGQLYAAKTGFRSLDDETKESKINLAREVNLLSQLHHPSILKFIGYNPYNFEKINKPIIITEYSPFGSLFDILELERSGRSPNGWDSTKKLINIYGISIAMSYLHSNNIVHRDLKPQNILEDEYLFPKISDFGFSKIYHQNLESITIQSTVGFKGTPIYIAPEIWKTNKYTKEGDVYAFSLILYEIVTGERPFDQYSSYEFVVDIVGSGKRPEFRYQIPDSYRSLIERCWSEDPENRPTFDQIVTELRDNHDYITGDVDEDDFLNYIDYIDQCQKYFDSGRKILTIEEVLEGKQTKLLIKTSLKKKKEKEDKNLSTIKEDEIRNIVPQTFYEEIKMSPFFIKMNQDAQNFFKYAVKPDQEDRNIVLSRNNLSNLSELILSNEFINVLKLFDKIRIELKYPSHDFEKMFDMVKKLKNNDLQRIHIHLLISSEETDFILGCNDALNSIEMNSCLKSICDSSFKGCSALKEIKIPHSVTRIDEMAFCNCVLLENMKFLSSVEFIGKEAFKGCSSLKEITIDPLKTNVDLTAFQDCPNLHTMNLISEDSKIFPFNQEPFSNITKIIINPFITTIKENAFKGFNSVKEIIIPSSITRIEYNAFNGCKLLKKINLPNSIENIDICVFYECNSLDEIILPSSLSIVNNYLFFGCSSLTEIKIPDSVLTISRYSFAHCTSLVSIELTCFLETIGEAAFKGCTSLEKIKIPLSLKTLDHRAFEGCKKLMEIGFISADNDDDYNLRTCEIGEYVFKNCTSLEGLNLLNYFFMRAIPIGFLKNCSSLTSFDMGPYNTICMNSFRGCSALSKIVLTNVKIIDENAFRDCKALNEIEIPQSIISLGESAFMNCTSLKKVTFSTNKLKSIEDHLFEGCTSLNEILLPSSISTIGKFAFSGCSSLKTIVIPKSLHSIGSCAFLNCSSLCDLEMPPDLIDIGEDCFKGCNAKINLPN